jgi:hypothetical protein
MTDAPLDKVLKVTIILLQMMWPEEQAFRPENFAIPRHYLDRADLLERLRVLMPCRRWLDLFGWHLKDQTLIQIITQSNPARHRTWYYHDGTRLYPGLS